jgi:hypothetical protein
LCCRESEQGARSLKFDPEKAEKAQESWRRESEKTLFQQKKPISLARTHALFISTFANFCFT